MGNVWQWEVYLYSPNTPLPEIVLGGCKSETHVAFRESPGDPGAGGARVATGWGRGGWVGPSVFPGICSASAGSSQPETRRLLFLGVGGRQGEGGWSQPGVGRLCRGRTVATRQRMG